MSEDNREDGVEAGDGFEQQGAGDPEGVSGGEAEGSSIFDLFEPPPEIDPNRFGPIPIVPDDPDAAADEVPDEVAEPVDGPDLDDESFDEADLDDFESDPTMLDEPTGEISMSEVGAALAGGAELEDDLDGNHLEDDDRQNVDADDAEVSNGLFDEPRGADLSADHDEGTVTVDELLAPLEGEGEPAAQAPDAAFFPDVPDATSGGLPHWTEPATGAVPAVLGGGEGDWSEVTGPQWQGEGPGEGDDLTAVFGDTAGVTTGTRIDDDEHADLDAPSAAGDQQRAGQGAVRPRPRPAPVEDDSSGRNVPQAIAVGVILAGLAILAFQLGAAATITLICVICVLGAVELFNSMRMAGLHPATLLGIVASAALPLAIYHRGEPGYVLVSALTLVFGALWYLVGADSHRPALNLGLTFLGVQWVGGLASFAALLVLAGDPGIDMILAAVIVTVVFDTAAYAGGRVFGSHPFHPASPNKTWEGTIIGVVGAVLAGFIVGILEISPFSGDLVHAILLGLVAGILAPIGDLTESLIKRDLGVKDMGAILPGHGGVLDRLDGLLFVLPGVYYLARVLELI